METPALLESWWHSHVGKYPSTVEMNSFGEKDEQNLGDDRY